MTAPPAEAMAADTLTAADAETSADRIEDQAARGAPPKWVAALGAAELRRIAAGARTRPGAGRLTAAAAAAAADWVEYQVAGGMPARRAVGLAAASLRWIAGQDRAGWPEEAP